MPVWQAIKHGKQFNATAALSNFNLSVDNGEIYYIPGRHGAGKTTRINSIPGCIENTSNKVFSGNKQMQSYGTGDRSVSALFANYYLHTSGQEKLGRQINNYIIKQLLQRRNNCLKYAESFYHSVRRVFTGSGFRITVIKNQTFSCKLAFFKLS